MNIKISNFGMNYLPPEVSSYEVDDPSKVARSCRKERVKECTVYVTIQFRYTYKAPGNGSWQIGYARRFQLDESYPYEYELLKNKVGSMKIMVRATWMKFVEYLLSNGVSFGPAELDDIACLELVQDLITFQDGFGGFTPPPN